ncbi:SLAM family member 8-like [Hemitrygon akajei]|uniref:SLAM family member 8-like n=1 Tax=Hemitrygon akajei TaxID=2704970 RepID=UPI003BF946A4
MWVVSSLLCVATWVACLAGASPTTEYGAQGDSFTLHPGITVRPDVAQVVWRLLSPRKKIVTYSNRNSEYYGSEEYKQRITFHPGDFSLKIRDLQREDTGDYEVTVTASSGTQTQREIRLQVVDRVSGTDIKVQYTAKTCNITLICSADSGSSISFRWWRGGEAAGSGSHYHLQQHGEEKGVNEVLYTCEVWNPISDETTEIWLGDICENTKSAGTGASPITVNGARGDSVSLHPGILVGPNIAELVWSLLSPRKKIVAYSNKVTEFYGSEEYKRRITFHPGDFSLEIRDLQREDTGDYEVTVTASSGAQTQRVMRLQVYDRVSGTDIKVQYTAKTCNITLICSADSGSSISFRWWRGGEAVGSGSHYHLQQHGEEKQVKEVLYKCEAWNPISKETTEVWLGDICEKTKSDPDDRTSHIAWIILVIMILILLCCGILYIKRHDLRSRWDKRMGKKSGTSDGMHPDTPFSKTWNQVGRDVTRLFF